jgi:hypothetical protein
MAHGLYDYPIQEKHINRFTSMEPFEVRRRYRSPWLLTSATLTMAALEPAKHFTVSVSSSAAGVRAKNPHSQSFLMASRVCSR